MSLTLTSIICNGSIEKIFNLISNASCWPGIFKPCLSVKIIDRDEQHEHIEINALVNGKETMWQSKRYFDKSTYTVKSYMTLTMPMVSSLETIWKIIPINISQNIIILEHRFEIADNFKEQLQEIKDLTEAELYVKKAIEANSHTELKNIKNYIEKIDNVITFQKSWISCHQIVCNVNLNIAYDLLKNMEIWPSIFENCLKVTKLYHDNHVEKIKVVAKIGAEIADWETVRTYYDDYHTIVYTVDSLMPLLKSMNGVWYVVPISFNKCIIHVVRHFELVDDVKGIFADVETTEDAKKYIDEFSSRNANLELLSFKIFLENNGACVDVLYHKYEIKQDVLSVYNLFSDIKKWKKILPHCKDIDIIYDDGINQEFTMHVVSDSGESETFRSIRKCDYQQLNISYFQPNPPSFLKLHTGDWQFKVEADKTFVVAKHFFELDIDKSKKIFQNDDVRFLKSKVKEILQKNTTKTVETIFAILESRACLNEHA